MSFSLHNVLLVPVALVFYKIWENLSGVSTISIRKMTQTFFYLCVLEEAPNSE